MLAISLTIACSRYTYDGVIFPHIPFVVNHTINATPPERLQQYYVFLSSVSVKRHAFGKDNLINCIVALTEPGQDLKDLNLFWMPECFQLSFGNLVDYCM